MFRTVTGAEPKVPWETRIERSGRVVRVQSKKASKAAKNAAAAAARAAAKAAEEEDDDDAGYFGLGEVQAVDVDSILALPLDVESGSSGDAVRSRGSSSAGGSSIGGEHDDSKHDR